MFLTELRHTASIVEELRICLLIKQNATHHTSRSTHRYLVNICGMNKLTNVLATEYCYGKDLHSHHALQCYLHATDTGMNGKPSNSMKSRSDGGAQ